jgi:endonuclease III
VPVDQGLCRLAVRLGIAAPRANLRRLSREVRRALDRELPAELAARRHAVLYLAHHAQATCVEGDPHCGICPLAPGCEEGRRRINSRTPGAGAMP